MRPVEPDQREDALGSPRPGRHIPFRTDGDPVVRGYAADEAARSRRYGDGPALRAAEADESPLVAQD